MNKEEINLVKKKLINVLSLINNIYRAIEENYVFIRIGGVKHTISLESLHISNTSYKYMNLMSHYKIYGIKRSSALFNTIIRQAFPSHYDKPASYFCTTINVDDILCEKETLRLYEIKAINKKNFSSIVNVI